LEEDYSNIKMKDAVLAGLPDLIKSVLLMYPMLFMSKTYNMEFHIEPEFQAYSIIQKVNKRYNL